MSSLAQLEEQINALNTLNRSSAKALDTFADTSNAISVRARQITRDVKPWEIAQENIALTIEEMSKAARCYHPPPSLYAVLNKQEKSPETVGRCIDYLVYTADYLAVHAKNDYGIEISGKTEKQVEAIVLISEELVTTSFLRALQKPTPTTTGSAVTPISAINSRGLVVKNPAVLEHIGQIIERLGENFDLTTVVTVDVHDLLTTKLTALINSQFDASYKEEEGGKSQTSSHASVSPILKHYQPGDHRLLAISKMARSATVEVCNCVNEHILSSLADNYDVAKMPSAIATVAFDIIVERAMAVIDFNKSVFDNPTKMFLDSRGQGIDLCPGARYFRDVIFVGLDLIQEMWQWKTLANELPGDRDDFIDYVDERFDEFVDGVRTLLDYYVSKKGELDKDLLKEYSTAQHRAEWFPASDCTAHESATNMLYFHKCLLTTYYGALKIALYNDSRNPEAEAEAVKEIEDFLVRCVLGTIADLQKIADAASELQHEAEEKKHRGLKARKGLSHLLTLSGGVHISPSIFLLNNLIFLEGNYKQEPCFSQRTMPPDATDSAPTGPKTTARGKGRVTEPVSIPIVTHLLAMLEDERERCIEEFGRSWETCFPLASDDPDLRSINPDASQTLRSSQCTAVKKWHKVVTKRLSDKLRDCRNETVMSTAFRNRLIELSVQTVEEHFAALDETLLGRTWTSNPQKWMPFTRQDWIEQIKKIF